MKKYWPGLFVLTLAAACGDDVIGSDDPPIALDGAMKLAADSLRVTLRVTNLSDTTQIVLWNGCNGGPANFALYRDAGLQNLVWEQRQDGPSTCSADLGEHALAPDESFTIRGTPAAVTDMLEDASVSGNYYVAVLPQNLAVRPVRGSYDAPVEAKVPVGLIELRRD
jgi:hypothetical protein